MKKLLLSMLATSCLLVAGCDSMSSGKFEGEITETQSKTLSSNLCVNTQYNYEVLYSFETSSFKKNGKESKYMVDSYCTNKKFKIGEKVKVVVDRGVIKAVLYK